MHSLRMKISWVNKVYLTLNNTKQTRHLLVEGEVSLHSTHFMVPSQQENLVWGRNFLRKQVSHHLREMSCCCQIRILGLEMDQANINVKSYFPQCHTPLDRHNLPKIASLLESTLAPNAKTSPQSSLGL